MKLQDFINDAMKGQRDTLIYKDSGINQMVWVRDVIGHSLFRCDCYVHTTHTSKSVSLPVYTFTLRDHKIHIRGNFHDWCVAIDTPCLGVLPGWMMKSFDTGYYEGMDTEGCDKFCVGSREKMFAVLWWLEKEGLKIPLYKRAPDPREIA
jgi:hypothetical protein